MCCGGLIYFTSSTILRTGWSPRKLAVCCRASTLSWNFLHPCVMCQMLSRVAYDMPRICSAAAFSRLHIQDNVIRCALLRCVHRDIAQRRSSGPGQQRHRGFVPCPCLVIHRASWLPPPHLQGACIDTIARAVFLSSAGFDRPLPKFPKEEALAACWEAALFFTFSGSDAAACFDSFRFCIVVACF